MSDEDRDAGTGDSSVEQIAEDKIMDTTEDKSLNSSSVDETNKSKDDSEKSKEETDKTNVETNKKTSIATYHVGEKERILAMR